MIMDTVDDGKHIELSIEHRNFLTMHLLFHFTTLKRFEPYEKAQIVIDARLVIFHFIVQSHFQHLHLIIQ